MQHLQIWMCSDTSPDPQVPNPQFHSEEGRDVASCGIDVEILEGEGDIIKATTTVNNVQVHINISNTGAIPVKRCSSSIDNVDTTALAVGLLTAQGTQLHPGTLHVHARHSCTLGRYGEWQLRIRSNTSIRLVKRSTVSLGEETEDVLPERTIYNRII